jgi:L-ribulose-5-phosphate 3-epimerase
MNRLRIGLRLESLGLALRPALQEATRLGVSGVQVGAAGPLAPSALSQTGRREFRHLISSYNLELTAVGCPLRHGLDEAQGQEGRIDKVRRVMDLAFELGPRRVVVQAGPVPADAADPRLPPLREALQVLGQYGDRTGSVLALETGLEAGDALAAFLDGFDTGSLRVNLDPANLMANGFDPYAGARALRTRIVHAHAKDIRRSGPSRAVREVPVGHGDIDWLAFLGVLEEIEYRGWLVVEREAGDNRRADVAAGVAFLRRLVGVAD